MRQTLTDYLVGRGGRVVGQGGVTQKYELHASFKNARCIFEFLEYPNES